MCYHTPEIPALRRYSQDKQKVKIKWVQSQPEKLHYKCIVRKRKTPKVNQRFKSKTRHNDVSSIYNKHLRTVRQTKSILMSARCTAIKAKSVKRITSNSKSPAQKRSQWLSDVPHLITARKQRKGKQADILTSFFGHHPTNRTVQEQNWRALVKM